MRRKKQSEIRKKKREYNQRIAESVRDNSKELRRFFRYKSNKPTLPDTLTHGDLRFSSSQTKADAFNSYFTSVFGPSTLSSSLSDLQAWNDTDVGLEVVIPLHTFFFSILSILMRKYHF